MTPIQRIKLIVDAGLQLKPFGEGDALMMKDTERRGVDKFIAFLDNKKNIDILMSDKKVLQQFKYAALNSGILDLSLLEEMKNALDIVFGESNGENVPIEEILVSSRATVEAVSEKMVELPQHVDEQIVCNVEPTIQVQTKNMDNNIIEDDLKTIANETYSDTTHDVPVNTIQMPVCSSSKDERIAAIRKAICPKDQKEDVVKPSVLENNITQTSQQDNLNVVKTTIQLSPSSTTVVTSGGISTERAAEICSVSKQIDETWVAHQMPRMTISIELEEINGLEVDIAALHMAFKQAGLAVKKFSTKVGVL